MTAQLNTLSEAVLHHMLLKTAIAEEHRPYQDGSMCLFKHLKLVNTCNYSTNAPNCDTGNSRYCIQPCMLQVWRERTDSKVPHDVNRAADVLGLQHNEGAACVCHVLDVIPQQHCHNTPLLPPPTTTTEMHIVTCTQQTSLV